MVDFSVSRQVGKAHVPMYEFCLPCFINFWYLAPACDRDVRFANMLTLHIDSMRSWLRRRQRSCLCIMVLKCTQMSIKAQVLCCTYPCCFTTTAGLISMISECNACALRWIRPNKSHDSTAECSLRVSLLVLFNVSCCLSYCFCRIVWIIFAIWLPEYLGPRTSSFCNTSENVDTRSLRFWDRG